MNRRAEKEGLITEWNETNEKISMESTSTDVPAIGVVMSGEDADMLARVVLRAHRRGHNVLVIHLFAERSSGVIDFTQQLGASVVSVPRATTETEAWETLAQTACEYGYPGLICHRDLTEYIDYDRSLDRLRTSETYTVDAEPGVSPDEQTELELLVAIPAYNEAATIADVVADASSYADCVLVVDDGSDDATVARARDAGAVVVEHERNKGYGGALRTIFREGQRRRASCLVVIDGDGQHRTADIPRLVQRLDETDADLVIGNRFEGENTEIPIYRQFGLWVINVLTNASMGIFRPRDRVTDTQSGFRAYGRQAIRTLAEDETIGTNMAASIDILHHAHRQGYTIEDVGTTISYDVEDASSQNPVTHGLALVSTTLRTIEREHPIGILGIPGFLVTFVGFGFSYWSITVYLRAGVLPFGPALASVFCLLFGIFAVFTAIVLHSLETHL